jgi:aromatic-L-amino-acid decarboxylase
MLSLFSFRHVPDRKADIDTHNLGLVSAINDEGRVYLTQTLVDGKLAIRFQAGQFETTEADVDEAFNAITACARRLA